MNDQTNCHDQQACRERAKTGRQQKATARANHDDDEYNFHPFEHHGFECRKTRNPVEVCLLAQCCALKLRLLFRKGVGFVVQGNDARPPQNGFPQPAQAEQEKENADHQLQSVERHLAQNGTKDQDDQGQHRQRRAGAEEGWTPPAHRGDSENDCEGLHHFNQ